MKVWELRELLEDHDPDVEIGVYVDGTPQGHRLEEEPHGFNERENILWFRATAKGTT